MKRLWPGWLLCLVTAGLFAYMALVESAAISALLGGWQLPDGVPLGYDADAARALFDVFVADFSAAQVEGRQSASEAYLALHAGFDLLFPPLLAMSIAFCAFAATYSRQDQAETPRLAKVGLGLALALAFAYLGFDFFENAVADTIYGPKAIMLAFNEQMVFVLQVLTRGKYLSLIVAIVLIVALWIARRKRMRSTKADT
ncbi:hypothetical protein IMCC20628_03063 [Hoeflea sp. IMCC20628]|uniref:hypothetical protein n=1 Tax=Hoeflea sp. IMCC20628 TaxID=1620421 RepID=UPI00063AC5AD|nr:hypothetical protein [Hoeflea sp. IMCC20628]AKI01757.1 hypothetical protein IMCC20628_03063 [Hoeflea sp. IMCC20628]